MQESTNIGKLIKGLTFRGIPLGMTDDLVVHK